jgi:Putative binding domain, N-terminal
MKKQAYKNLMALVSLFVLWVVPSVYAQAIPCCGSVGGCMYSVSPVSQSFMAGGGDGSVRVNVPSLYVFSAYSHYLPPQNCGWTARSNVSWLTITSGSDGSGDGTVSFTVTANPSPSRRTGTLTIAGKTFTVSQPGAGETRAFFVPIVLSAPGPKDSFYTSELVLTNRGKIDASLEFNYTAAFGGGSGTALDWLAAGKQLTASDAIAYLRSKGIPISGSGNHGGTLRVRFSGISSLSDVAVTVPTSTAVAGGRAGLAYPGIPTVTALTNTSYLFGLRQNSEDRSNVALQNVGTPAEGDIVLRLTVYSGDRAAHFSQILPDERLAPGGFKQISEVLNSNGLSLTQGYIRVERISGTAPYYAYAVINDQANSDGSFVPPTPEKVLGRRTGLTLPALVETPFFTSELTMANWSTAEKTLHFAYVADAIQAPGSTANFTMTLKPGEQSILPDFVQVLRNSRVAGIGPVGPAYIGALFATVGGGDASGIFLGARTSRPGGGGRYGLFYVAVPSGEASSTSAWLNGLQQNSESRTNLALVNTGEIDGSSDVFNIELFDGETGLKANTVEGITLKAKGWAQIGGILARYAPGVTQGYARVTRTGGSNPFIAYAVINDGSRPGERTGDGIFISSSPD